MPRSPGPLIAPSLGLGLFLSLPMSAFVFNVVPQAALAVAPLVCKGDFIIHPSARRTSHEYLCQAAAGGGAPTDVTFLASALTWVLLWLVLSGVALAALSLLLPARKS